MTRFDGRRWSVRLGALVACGAGLLAAGPAQCASVISTAEVIIAQPASVTGAAVFVLGTPVEIARSAAYTNSLLQDPSVVVDGVPNLAYSLSMPENITVSFSPGGSAVGTLRHDGGMTPTVGQQGTGGVAVWGNAELKDVEAAGRTSGATAGFPPALPGPHYVNVVVNYN